MLDWLKKIRLRTPAKFVLAGTAFFLLIGFVENKQHRKICTGVKINIEDTFDTYFINEQDVWGLLTQNGTQRIEGEPFREINLKNLELRLKTNKFVKSCQVYADLTGRLNVSIRQNRPLARVIDPGLPDAYISEDGDVLPLSERFTARVVLLEGAGLKKIMRANLQTDSTGKAVFELLQRIDRERFFKALVAQITVGQDGNIRMYPQVGRQTIEFGKPVDMERKFENIRIFYRQILPARGWNRYSRVSVAYDNQIVCE